MKSTTLRFHGKDHEKLYDWLKDEHARTYPQHRLSFNAWMVGKLEKVRKETKAK